MPLKEWTSLSLNQGRSKRSDYSDLGRTTFELKKGVSYFLRMRNLGECSCNFQVLCKVVMASSSSLSEDVSSRFTDFPDKPHQPLNLDYPKRMFGKKTVVERKFQASWYSQWPFLHYEESSDQVFCHTCVMGFKLKRMRTNSADSAFVSSDFYNERNG